MTNIKKQSLNRVVSTRLTDDDYASFVTIAQQNKMSTTALIRQLVIQCLDKQKTTKTPAIS